MTCYLLAIENIEQKKIYLATFERNQTTINVKVARNVQDTCYTTRLFSMNHLLTNVNCVGSRY